MRCLLVVALVAVALAPPAGAVGAGAAPFGTRAIETPGTAPFPEWRRVLDALGAERGLYERCAREPAACPSRAIVAWNALLRDLEGRDRLAQLRAVNRFVNRWPYRSDARNFGRSDHWATPAEFLRDSGDCEDYAITKYVSLRRLGFVAEDLRLVVLRDTRRDLVHAVTTVRIGDEVYVLDNLADEVLPHRRLAHYRPYYSINEDARWLHLPGPSAPTVAIGPRLLHGDGPVGGR